MNTEGKILEELGFPQEVRDALTLAGQEIQKRDREYQRQIEEEIQALTGREEWEKAREKLQSFLAPDERGMKMLWCMVQSLEFSRSQYRKRGISEEIFLETMKCFPRFVREHKESFGVYGFDRDFWTGRQLSLQLFRIGELEYEFGEEEGKKVIWMHIPSDAVLEPQMVGASLEKAECFFQNYEPSWSEAEYWCSSWLLSPALKELLPETSRILWFQSLFQLQKTDRENPSFLEWVYKRKDLPLDQLPQETSLQKNMKRHLLAGGWVGEGLGILKKLQL